MSEEILKTLPKYMHGEFKQRRRKAAFLQKQIEELTKLQDEDIDVSTFFNEEAEDKYFKQWCNLPSNKEDFESNDRSIEAFAYQSCWPAEGDAMLFQYLYSYLKARPKWWVTGHWHHDQIVLNKREPTIKKGCLPNINCFVYACHGDYGEKLHIGPRISKMKELYNYASSPNLRENATVTSIYAGIAKTYQYCDVKFKIEGEEVTTTIAELVLRLREKEGNAVFGEICRNQCHQCRSNEHESGASICDEHGNRTLSDERRLVALCQNDIDLAIKMKHSLTDEELKAITKDTSLRNSCPICIFRKQPFADSKKIFKLLLGRDPVI